ncbi:PH domain-containing protein [Streptomyces sp. NPDC002838]|uniref:PH domain-containing protein n=1 Tax=Streptomyces sp. NPDC002838 TaxID=3154436 RepID=UPI00332943A7
MIAASGIFFADSGRPSVTQRTVCTVAALAGVALSVRVARLAIIVKPDHLLVRNIFRTYKVPWEQITSIDPPKRYGATRKTGIVISRTDGSALSATAYVRGPHNREQFAESVANDLQRIAAGAVGR